MSKIKIWKKVYLSIFNPENAKNPDIRTVDLHTGVLNYDDFRKKVLYTFDYKYTDDNYHFIIPKVTEYIDISKNKKYKLEAYVLDYRNEWSLFINHTDLNNHIFIVHKDYLDHIQSNNQEYSYYDIKEKYIGIILLLIEKIYNKFVKNNLVNQNLYHNAINYALDAVAIKV
jgi:hypothetical protein